jgi:hypothetical protein
MPTFHRLTDGRLLLFWSNTAVFPDDHRQLTDEDFRHTKKGRFTHGFTNRDVLHTAISKDDGRTWSGFRELILSPALNAPNYALGDDLAVLGDKSMHQSQALNLPGGKVLVAVGQHPECRRLIVFDPDWLCETERGDDFSCGLEQWSTFLYVKGVKGFCAYGSTQNARRNNPGSPFDDNARRITREGGQIPSRVIVARTPSNPSVHPASRGPSVLREFCVDPAPMTAMGRRDSNGRRHDE